MIIIILLSSADAPFDWKELETFMDQRAPLIPTPVFVAEVYVCMLKTLTFLKAEMVLQMNL